MLHDGFAVENASEFKRRFTNGVENPESGLRDVGPALVLDLLPYVLEEAPNRAPGTHTGSFAGDFVPFLEIGVFSYRCCSLSWQDPDCTFRTDGPAAHNFDCFLKILIREVIVRSRRLHLAAVQGMSPRFES